MATVSLDLALDDEALLTALLSAIRRPRPYTATLVLGPIRDTATGRLTGASPMPETRLANHQEFDARIVNVQDAQGRPASFDGTPSWESNHAAVMLDVADDGMSARIYSGDALGSAVVTVTGDARHGEEVVPLIMTHTVHVYPPDVAMFEIQAGEVRDSAPSEPTV